MSESGDGHTIAESLTAQIRSRRPAGMEIASGFRERTHKDKGFIFRQIGHPHQQRTHSEHRLCCQLFTAISRPISANFKWMPPDCGIANYLRAQAGEPVRVLRARGCYSRCYTWKNNLGKLITVFRLISEFYLRTGYVLLNL